MADYKKMYDSLFNDVTDAISLLQRAQQKTEELFISGNDGVIVELKEIQSPTTRINNKTRLQIARRAVLPLSLFCCCKMFSLCLGAVCKK